MFLSVFLCQAEKGRLFHVGNGIRTGSFQFWLTVRGKSTGNLDGNDGETSREWRREMEGLFDER